MTIGPVMIDLEGLTLTDEEKEMLNHPLVGGLIFFARNYESPEQLSNLVNEIKDATEQTIITCVDQEGGRVQRFKEGMSILPPLRQLGHIYDQNTEEGMAASKAMGWLMASEVRALGVDFSFAPVLDLDYGVSEVIGNRAFHTDENKVSQLARAYIQGMDDAGMACVGKHFPGHGAVVADSHLELPVDDRKVSTIMDKDVLPFEELIDLEIVQGIMPAHVVYSDMDTRPAGFSKAWLQQVLRTRLRFEGAIFSDDLNMAAAGIAGTFVERAELALNAGCDMILVCNNRPGALEVLEGLNWDMSQESSDRLEKMIGRKSPALTELKQDQRWDVAHNAASEIAQFTPVS